MGKFKSNYGRSISHPLLPLVWQDEKFFFSPEASMIEICIRIWINAGKVEEGLILYLNTGLCWRTTCILTRDQLPDLSRCPIVWHWQVSELPLLWVTEVEALGDLQLGLRTELLSKALRSLYLYLYLYFESEILFSKFRLLIHYE